MRNGWGVTELAAVSAINYGYTESATSEPLGPRFLRITDIQDDRVDWESVPYCKIDSADLPKYRLESGDIVFARTGATTGKSFLVEEPPLAVFASYLIRLRLLDSTLLPEFVSLFFQTAGYWQSIRSGLSGSAQGGFNASKLGALTIPVPPLPEQKRIVASLDDAFSGIAIAKANAEKNIKNARDLFECHLQSAFTPRGKDWVDKRLGDVLRTGAGGTPLKSKKEYYEGGSIPWLMSGEVSQGEVTSATKFITPKGLQNSSARIFPKNTVLVAMYGATAGEVGILRFEASTNQAVCGILPSDTFFPKFLYYVLLSKKRELIDQATGNAQPNISQVKIKNTNLPVLALANQEEIVKELDALRDETQRLESIYQRKLVALGALKQALLHQAFSGQL